MKQSIWKKLSRVGLAALLTASLAVLGACGGETTTPAPEESPAAEATSEASPEAEDSPEPSEQAATTDDAATQEEGQQEEASTQTFDNVTLKVGASPAPHKQILESVAADLAAQGITLEIIEFTDYILPNVAVTEGEIDANFFQHLPYLEDYNAENGTDIASVGMVHFEPMGIFAGKSASLDELPEGAQVAVPNDPTNEARALQLLAAQGLITLKDGVGLSATKLDIVDNPKKLEFFEVKAAQVPRSLQDVDIAVINGNYALEAGLSLQETLAAESAQSEAAQKYGNILAVANGADSRPEIQALYAALTGENSRKFIEETYQGAVVPVF